MYKLGQDELVPSGGIFEREGSRYDARRWAGLLNAPFKISAKCCNELKKKPLKKLHLNYIVGELAEESLLRTQAWLRRGCNSFSGDKRKSNPMAFWTKQDVLQYIRIMHMPIADVYGEIIDVGKDGRQTFDGCGCKLQCSGAQRTGCVYCLFGAHHTDKGTKPRLVALREEYPDKYDYIMRGGEWAQNENGKQIWQPNKEGLGFRFVIDWLNKEYGKGGNPFIET